MQLATVQVSRLSQPRKRPPRYQRKVMETDLETSVTSKRTTKRSPASRAVDNLRRERAIRVERAALVMVTGSETSERRKMEASATLGTNQRPQRQILRLSMKHQA